MKYCTKRVRDVWITNDEKFLDGSRKLKLGII